MKKVVVFDTEVTVHEGKIKDIGAITDSGERLHTASIDTFLGFIDGASFLCGHNIIHHDLKYVKKQVPKIQEIPAIDTLYLSPLLYPKKPYHNLVKDDKLLTEQLNNPLNDSIKARDLLLDEVGTYHRLKKGLKRIYYGLLHKQREFKAFFDYMEISYEFQDLAGEIKAYFNKRICENVPLDKLIEDHPIELAYSLALISVKNKYSITPPWVLKSFPNVDRVMHLLRSKPCLEGCGYCNRTLDPNRGLKKYFGYDSYRTYDGEPLQERAVSAALNNQSLLAVFPTGGGKSITFQVPALMAGKASRGLTVVISPLQSLMKDQVDNLEAIGITDAATINGLLDPIERAIVLERVESGDISILYISPESLRSKSIERLLLGRKIVRFVIDEAHCFSSWGHDFRVDYLYIGDFIKMLCEMKQLDTIIPVSCFTATAKQRVIVDIKHYFLDKLGLELELFTAGAERKNLSYTVLKKDSKEDKYNTLRTLIDTKNCPTIVYVSRTKLATELAERLRRDGYNAKTYHGQMDKQEKSSNQEAFIRGDVDIMVATSAFGMGVDKKDIGLVIHYQISDSLENYVQEAGRAARDQRIQGECYILYHEEDLNEHFTLLNQTKLTISEVQQIWKAVKEITRYRSRVANSALEIARTAGWDDNVHDIETRVKTSIAALEEAGYLKRGQNMLRVYADSILVENAMDANNRIRNSKQFNEKDREIAVRIITKLIGARSRKSTLEEVAESRIDYISDQLGILKEDVVRVVQLLRMEGILSDAKDLTAFVNEELTRKGALNRLNTYRSLEGFLLESINEHETIINIKELNEAALLHGLKRITTDKILTLFNYWAIKHWVKREYARQSRNHMKLTFCYEKSDLIKQYEKRVVLSAFIINYLYGKHEAEESESTAIEFSVLELKYAFEDQQINIVEETTVEAVENALYFLSRIGALKIEGGFMVLYSAISLERLELDNRIQYKKEDYKSLKEFYEQKVHQIHIVGEYANKMLEDYREALTFVNDYFQLNYKSFLVKYFNGSKGDEIQKNITPEKFRQLFGQLSPAQLGIIKDNATKYVVVAAGPGSGKTRILVHKLASLLLMEDVKHEQLLMVTFSRAAATEFKKRLIKLIGSSANYVEIKTFHSYCFDLLGRVGSLEKSDNIVREAAQMINKGEVEPSRITKSVMVIDEAQDMDENEFTLVRALAKRNENMRIIAVGDDDQNIYEFRGSSATYMKKILGNDEAKRYELVENYRSKSNLVAFTNRFVRHIPNRMKEMEIIPSQKDHGEIEIIHYQHNKMIGGLVQNLLSKGIRGSLCILTKTNHEALQITGQLIDKGINAKLIQSNNRYRLNNLDEIRYFLSKLKLTDEMAIIDDESWKLARKKLIKRYKRSENLVITKRLLKDFEATCGKYKYVSDFQLYLMESKIEDFYGNDHETVYVSTMHKAKGREFDHVILMLNRFNINTEENKRLLYVAMTRAKEKLHIHYDGRYLHQVYQNNVTRNGRFVREDNEYSGNELYRNQKIEGLTFREETSYYGEEGGLIVKLGYHHVFLDYFYEPEVQETIKGLRSGDGLLVDPSGCLDSNGVRVLKFSKRFRDEIEKLESKGYRLADGKVDYVFYWEKEEAEREVRILLVEVRFVKGEGDVKSL